MKKPTQQQNKNAKTTKQAASLQPTDLANVVGGGRGFVILL